MHVAGVTLSFGLTVRVITLLLTFCLGSIVVAFLREGSKALAQMRFHTESPGGLGRLGSSFCWMPGLASNSNLLFLEFQFIFCDCDQFFLIIHKKN